MHFVSEPTHSELWDACVHELLYKRNGTVPYFAGIESVIKNEQARKVLDTCAGSGFPAIYLRSRGYDVDCVETSPLERATFQQRARAAGVSEQVQNMRWEDLSRELGAEQYDFAICRGSIWYAAGGYCDREFVPNKETLLAAMDTCIGSFAKMLKQGGALYIDKYQDDEVDHNDKVADIIVGDEAQELYFRMCKRDGVRTGSMIRRKADGTEIGEPCTSAVITDQDLEAILRRNGLEPERIHVPGEYFFTTYLARKQ